jgi:HEAT repeat protein
MFIRQAAAGVLEKWATAEQAPALIKALNDSHWPVLHAAIRALGRLKEPRAAEPIAGHFGNQRDRHLVAEALKQIGGPEAEKAMRRALKDKDPFVRQAAAQVLKDIGTKDSLPDLEAAANDPDTFVRMAAADAVRAIRARSR